ncbi:MAG: hypothetical protein Phog2KO_39990 [Phototrophicaceae bacterium]
MVNKKYSNTEVQRASQATVEDLLTIANQLSQENISELSVPQIEEIVKIVGRVVPAGNVPGLIASGLARLKGKNPSSKEVKRDINMLFHGMNHMLDHAVYGVFFMGPAQVIWGYQNLLKLTGKNLEEAFPDGTWQFYVDYALREDTARHTNETVGFDTALYDNSVHVKPVDRMTAWAMTAIKILHQYPQLLENEWRERVYINELIKISHETNYPNLFQTLYDDWLKVLPYRRKADARGDESYPSYRRRKFDEWLFPHIEHLPHKIKQDWQARLKLAKKQLLPAYIKQMSIHSFLKPEQYAEVRTPIPVENLHIAIIYGEHYYLIPITKADSSDTVDIDFVRGAVKAIMQQPSTEAPAKLEGFATIKRYQWEGVRRKLPNKLVEDLSMLRLCPIVLNFNPHEQEKTLAEIRQSERGIGDHALTIFDTGETFVFDQSHIYFDGTWGVALAEIMTNEALHVAYYLSQQAPATATTRPYSPSFEVSSEIHHYLSTLERVTPEVSSENDEINLENLLSLRQLFKHRDDLKNLTVNDILLLYRAIHAVTYQADPDILEILTALAQDKFSKVAGELALEALKANPAPPAILIPVDASRQSPRDRLHPISIAMPLNELHLLDLHKRVIKSLDDAQANKNFDKLQGHYLTALSGFGEVMQRAKEIANAGESASVGTIKLLAHIPLPLQHLLNQIPSQFDMLNDIIKGREVFSNIGQVAKESKLRRFITAKDDNQQKDLAWGVLTDTNGKMMITLRDFRPHVRALIDIEHYDLAQAMTNDYLRAYASGFNAYIEDLQRITLNSAETTSLT